MSDKPIIVITTAQRDDILGEMGKLDDAYEWVVQDAVPATDTGDPGAPVD